MTRHDRDIVETWDRATHAGRGELTTICPPVTEAPRNVYDMTIRERDCLIDNLLLTLRLRCGSDPYANQGFRGDIASLTNAITVQRLDMAGKL